MKRLAIALISAILAAASLRCRAEQACAEVAVEASIEGDSGELTLADVLAPGTCAQVRNAAARVDLGTVPRSGRVRVLDGREIRRRLEEADGGLASVKPSGITIPERIVVKRRGDQVLRGDRAIRRGLGPGRGFRERSHPVARGSGLRRGSQHPGGGAARAHEVQLERLA